MKVKDPQALAVAAWGCHCHRCGHDWMSVCRCGPVAAGAAVHKATCRPPAYCAKCKSPAWAYPLDEEGPGKRPAKRKKR